jgi:hypothetical protein
MSRSAQFGRNLLLALILSVFLLPVANAGLVEIYINKSEELTESETDFVIESGRDLNLEIRLSGALRIDSGDRNLSITSIYIDVYFDSDTDRRESTSGIPQYQSLKETETDPGYDTFISKFNGDDTRFQGYEGQIRFSIILKNASNDIIPGGDRVILITMEAPAKEESISSGFSLPALPDEIADNLLLIVAAIIGIVILSVGVYQFVLAPEDTTADVYRQKESIDPLKKSLTGVGYESELPSESKLHRLENREKDSEEEEEEDDEGEYEYEDDDDDDEEFDERAMLDKLTGNQTLEDTSDNDDGTEGELAAAPKKKAVKKTVAKKKIAKKKIVKKAAPVKKTSEPETNMGKGVNSVTCPSCEKVHHVEENTTKFICSCGRRIRV